MYFNLHSRAGLKMSALTICFLLFSFFTYSLSTNFILLDYPPTSFGMNEGDPKDEKKEKVKDKVKKWKKAQPSETYRDQSQAKIGVHRTAYNASNTKDIASKKLTSSSSVSSSSRKVPVTSEYMSIEKLKRIQAASGSASSSQNVSARPLQQNQASSSTSTATSPTPKNNNGSAASSQSGSSSDLNKGSGSAQATSSTPYGSIDDLIKGSRSTQVTPKSQYGQFTGIGSSAPRFIQPAKPGGSHYEAATSPLGSKPTVTSTYVAVSSNLGSKPNQTTSSNTAASGNVYGQWNVQSAKPSYTPPSNAPLVQRTVVKSNYENMNAPLSGSRSSSSSSSNNASNNQRGSATLPVTPPLSNVYESYTAPLSGNNTSQSSSGVAPPKPPRVNKSGAATPVKPAKTNKPSAEAVPPIKPPKNRGTELSYPQGLPISIPPRKQGTDFTKPPGPPVPTRGTAVGSRPTSTSTTPVAGNRTPINGSGAVPQNKTNAQGGSQPTTPTRLNGQKASGVVKKNTPPGSPKADKKKPATPKKTKK